MAARHLIRRGGARDVMAAAGNCAWSLRRARSAAPGGVWDRRDLWALEDTVPRYALDDAKLVLWRRMASRCPSWPPRRQAARGVARAAERRAAGGGEPPCLENWT